LSGFNYCFYVVCEQNFSGSSIKMYNQFKEKKMKRIKFVLPVIIAAVVMASCAGPSENRAEILERLEAGEIPEAVDVFRLDVETSRVAWEGANIRGPHDGTIGIKSGEFYVFEGEILGGIVVMDMNQIVVLDIEDPSRNARLRTHLESDDFFSVETYPTAEFEITSVEALPADYEGDSTHRVFGNMTIKGITHGIAFNAQIALSEDRMVSFADFDLDRSRWDVRFGSGRFFDNLGDNIIYDDFNLKLDLVAVN